MVYLIDAVHWHRHGFWGIAPGLNTSPEAIQKSIDLILHDFDSLPTVKQRKGWWRHIGQPCRDNLRIVWIR